MDGLRWSTTLSSGLICAWLAGGCGRVELSRDTLPADEPAASEGVPAWVDDPPSAAPESTEQPEPGLEPGPEDPAPDPEPEGCVAVEAPRPLSPLWTNELWSYGMSSQEPVFWADEGAAVIACVDEYSASSAQVLATDSGEFLGQYAMDGYYTLLGRDAAGRIEVRGGYDEVTVVDTLTDEVLWQDAELSSPFTVTLDPPSQSLAYVYCDWQDNAFAVTHVALESPPRARTLRSGVPCSVPNLSLAYDAGSDAVVFAAGLSGEIQIASFHDGTLRAVPLHEPVEASQALEAIAAFALSPDGELLAMVGADNQLCLWTFPALEPLGLCVNAGFVQNIGTCYCSPRSVASLAWSHDGQWLASASPQGDVLLRRRCDLQVVASQALPAELDDALPWRASFAPDDSGLIVEYGTYDLRTLLTYTRL